MTTATRSLFTEAIEDHLTLKKQNAHLDPSMPINRFDIGDPLDRYPGGPVKPALGGEQADSAASPADADSARPAPSATATSEADSAFGQPMSGMAPMLSLVEDVDEDDLLSPAPTKGAQPAEQPQAEVVRFPGGVGPRATDAPDAAIAATAIATTVASPVESSSATATLEHDDAASTGEQPVIMIDADEPIAPPAPTMREMAAADGKTKRPSFFNLRKRKKNSDDDPKGKGWFSSEPRDFRWDD
jgi:hypothetical protein